ncbi:hypothetical protein, partial [Pedobacter jejuensis]
MKLTSKISLYPSFSSKNILCINNKIFKVVKLFLFSIILLLFNSISANAIDFYWKSSGRADQNYTNAANWENSPGSGIPANGSLAPSSVDDVYFPGGNLTQTVNLVIGSEAKNFNVLAGQVITFSGASLSIYGDFTSNGKHLIGGNSSIAFLGSSGNYYINMGDAASHSSGSATFSFSGTGTYNLLSDFNLPSASLSFTNSDFISNGYDIRVSNATISNTISGGSKILNLSNSEFHASNGPSNVGALVFNANPVNIIYNFTNTELYLDQSNKASYISIGGDANGTILDGIKSLNFSEISTGISTAQIRSSVPNFTFNVVDFNINLVSFAFTSSGVSLNVTNLNLFKPVDITTEGVLILKVNKINETSSCVGQSNLRAAGTTPISFNATSPITTYNIGFLGVKFSNNTVTIPAQNDLGQNSGTYVTSAAASPRSFYWVGGNGNWNDPTEWSLLGSGGVPQTSSGCLPTLNDDVYFDVNSFTAAGQTVTIAGSGSQTAYARNVFWTDFGNEGKLAGRRLYINGSSDYSGCSGITSILVYFGSGNHTVKSGSNFIYASPNIQFLGVGTYTLVDNLKCADTQILITAGNFNSNGKEITAGNFGSNSEPASTNNLRNINISNSIITLTGGAAAFEINTQFLNSFDATGSTINLTNNFEPDFLLSGYVSTGAVTLNTLTFNDINFTSNTGSATFSNGGVLNFAANNVSFASNASIVKFGNTGTSHTVNTYNLAPGKSYNFTSNRVYSVVNAINSNSFGSCSPKVIISSNTSGVRASLYKAGLPFNINNAILKDINASGATLTVPGGEDLGNNLNVNITANPSQNFYWVGGTGNWTDATHWSIGISGGDPLVTNINNCIPGLADDVFFDGNSFAANNQIVTIDNNVSCRNMLWDNTASSKTPIFAGASTFFLNTYGSVTLAKGMTFPFNGIWFMRGTSQTTNVNALLTNGVSVSSALSLSGNGRYDLLDKFLSTNEIVFSSGQFYTNSKNITAAALSLAVTGTNKADISNSIITLNGTNGTATYSASHSSNANWNAAGSTINVSRRNMPISITAGVTVDYGKIVMNPSIVGSAITISGGKIKATDITWLSSQSRMGGNFEVGNLSYPTSSTNAIGGNNTITVTNKLTANGTPCNPISFYSTTAGTAATLNSTACDFDLKFARLTDITAGSCSASQNKVVGDDAGGNSNWTFSTIAAAQYLGADDTILACNQYPYTLTTSGFNEGATAYLWNDGSTGPDLIVTGPGTYSVTVTYGTGCTLKDEITLGLTPSPILNPATIYACETALGSKLGDFNLVDANSLLVTVPANYTFTYHSTLADANANTNPLTIPYSSANKIINVRVLDNATGCFSTGEVSLNVKGKLTITATPTSPSSCIAADGSFKVSGLDAGEYYSVSYYKNGVNQTAVSEVASATGEIDITGLTIGNYTNIIATSLTGCETTTSVVEITFSPPSIPGSITASKEFICLPDATAINYSIDDVPGATTYNWVYTGTGATMTGQGTTNISLTFDVGATSGVLKVVASSACGISPERNLNINISNTPSRPTVFVTEASCTTTTATARVTSPTLDLTFSVDGDNYSNTTGIFTGLIPGSTYSITAKNANGCISEVTSITLAARPETPLVPVVTVTAQPVCGTPTGSISIAGTTGFLYSVDGGTYSATLTYSNLAPGTHSITAQSVDGCTSTATTVTIDPAKAEASAPSVTVTAQPVCGMPTGSISITGITGYLYSVDGGTYSATLVYTNLAPGTHSIT